jgi:hypothetical protein
MVPVAFIMINISGHSTDFLILMPFHDSFADCRFPLSIAVSLAVMLFPVSVCRFTVEPRCLTYQLATPRHRTHCHFAATRSSLHGRFKMRFGYSLSRHFEIPGVASPPHALLRFDFLTSP